MTHIDDFLRGYAEAILWANAYGPDGEPDDRATDAYLTPGKWWESIGLDLDDAKAFYANESPNLWATGCRDFRRHGHDFALTRNGHGAGFWDRGYGKVGEHLTESAKVYGEHSVITDDTDQVVNI